MSNQIQNQRSQSSSPDWVKLMMASARDPVFFCQDVLGYELWEKQQEIIRAVKKYNRVAVKSCNSAGKSFLAALAAVWFLRCHKNSIVITTAPTYRQVEKVIWGYIRNIWREATSKGIPMGGKVLHTEIRLSDVWYAMGFSTEDVDNFQGFHADHVFLIGDEASGIHPKIYGIKESILTGPDPHELLIGNPLRNSGHFYEAFLSNDPPAGYYKVKISAFDSPNITQPNHKVKGWRNLADSNWIEKQREDLGEKSPFWQSNVLGEFPIEDDASLISLSSVEDAFYRFENDFVYHPDMPSILAVDPARLGNDHTAFVGLESGRVELVDGYVGKRADYTQGKIMELCADRGYQHCVIDCGGLGGPILDNCRAMNSKVNFVEFNSSAKATNSDKYGDLVTEIWFSMAEKFRKGELAVRRHERLKSDLTTRKYRLPRGKMLLQSKEDMKKEQLPSPDYGDALAMALYVQDMVSGLKAFSRSRFVSKKSLTGASKGISGYGF